MLSKFDDFDNNLLKKHLSLCNLGSFSSDEDPPIALSNLAKKHLIRHKAGTYTYHVNVGISPSQVNAFPYTVKVEIFALH